MERPSEVFLSIIDPRLDTAIRKALKDWGHRSFPVPRGHSGWKVIEQLNPAMLILEVPEGDYGQISLLERMERHRQTRSIPVLVFTKDLRLEFRLRGVYEFFHDYEGITRCMEIVEEVLGRIQASAGKTTPAVLTLDDYRALEEVIHLKTGITLRRERVKRVEKAIRGRVAALGAGSCQEYIAHLRHDDVDQGEWRKLIPALTVEETSFFRTSDHFRALEEVAVPAILQRKVPGEPIRVWCAGCSSGEEAYSVAIALRETIPDSRTYPIQVIATDINEEMLEKARRGSYSQKTVRKIPAFLRKRYFVQSGDEYRPEKSLKKTVVFKNFNLQSPAAEFRQLFAFPVDVIFCRNVVIYFRKVTIQRLVECFHSILADDGYLFLGYSETLYKFRHRFRTLFWRETFFYQKRQAVEAPGGILAVEPGSPSGEIAAPELDGVPPREPAMTDPLEPSYPEDDLEELEPVLGDEPTSRRGRDRVVPVGETQDPYSLLAAGDVGAAEAIFGKVDEAGWDSLVGRAYASILDGRTEDAEEFLRKLRERDDTKAEGYYISGLIHHSRGKRVLASADYERAVYLDKDFYPASVQLAELHVSEGRVEDAIRGFRNAILSVPLSGLSYLVTLEGVFPSHRVPEILAEAIIEMEAARP